MRAVQHVELRSTEARCTDSVCSISKANFQCQTDDRVPGEDRPLNLKASRLIGSFRVSEMIRHVIIQRLQSMASNSATLTQKEWSAFWICREQQDRRERQKSHQRLIKRRLLISLCKAQTNQKSKQYIQGYKIVFLMDQGSASGNRTLQYFCHIFEEPKKTGCNRGCLVFYRFCGGVYLITCVCVNYLAKSR